MQVTSLFDGLLIALLDPEIDALLLVRNTTGHLIADWEETSPCFAALAHADLILVV